MEVPISCKTRRTAKYPSMFIMNVAVTVASGSNSLGNATLPISAALALIVLEDRNTDSEKAVQGQNATAR